MTMNVFNTMQTEKNNDNVLTFIARRILEMAKAHDLNIHAYLEYLLERRPSADMTDEQLEKLAPWNDDVRRACGNNARKEDLEM